ncbi:MAG: CDP-diacylglycerol--glycerol-3-phosphate 3-phosphatidyltransferase [Verrucomicrobia bacterium RIFCSPHIGHO2_12_FULL_41_10]|nr:MAG: CDP-diacylglycerol--glycerol-3-phosphate 3-phosphatidyltransferase [Verrucomicrobia bacterium RIFCSPHIGHO2_12_FULL_41_10]HLB33343.1 CDP-diacylglycerol--glycerol-3-phosphate 3-phosphatidyltransferase [Chthoniobacterales bacterium]
MNLSNQLTLSRLFLTLLFVIIISSSLPYSASIALVIFAIASFTDWLDGYVARRYHLYTNFGRLMDPLVDKILVAAAFICLIPLQAFPAWVVILIIARDFLITGLRLLAGEQGILLSAERLGKHKTAWQLITILFYLSLLSAREFSGNKIGNESIWITFSWEKIGPILVGITLLLTVYSGVAYLWKNRGLL